MGKWKWITGGLVVLAIILCMMTIYMQREFNNMRIAYNRADREQEMLKKDYEKLYNAYYSYERKIVKILEGNEHVFWAKDSSAYVIVQPNEILFSFYKKPRMEKEFHLFRSSEVAENARWLSIDEGNIDSLKPHQFISISLPVPDKFIIAESSGDMPNGNLVLEIVIPRQK